MRSSYYKVLGTAENYSDAAERVKLPGDTVIVERAGTQRQLVIKCPDGCGDTLSVNLDRRSGPAWRLYRRRNKWSLFPSIDRPTGCGSHFILSNGKVVWCDWWDWDDDEIAPELMRAVEMQLADQEFLSFVDVADRLDAIPWDVLKVCKILVGKQIAQEGNGQLRGHFRLNISAHP
jgi:hypothetical protein